MYRYPTRRERLEARDTKSLAERHVIALEYLCDVHDDRERAKLNKSW
jgi:hypothetical protein